MPFKASELETPPLMLEVLKVMHLGAQTERSTASRAVLFCFGACWALLAFYL